jgi:hypothetical protein
MLSLSTMLFKARATCCAVSRPSWPSSCSVAGWAAWVMRGSQMRCRHSWNTANSASSDRTAETSGRFTRLNSTDSAMANRDTSTPRMATGEAETLPSITGSSKARAMQAHSRVTNTSA